MALAELEAMRWERRAFARGILPLRAAFSAAGALLLVLVALYWVLHSGQDTVRLDHGRQVLAGAEPVIFRG